MELQQFTQKAVNSCNELLFKNREELAYVWYNYGIRDAQRAILKEYTQFLLSLTDDTSFIDNKNKIKLFNKILETKYLYDICNGVVEKKKILSRKISLNQNTITSKVSFKIEIENTLLPVTDKDFGCSIFLSQFTAQQTLDRLEKYK